MSANETTPRRGFSSYEFARRAERAQQIMADHSLDALLLTTPPNIRYFTGFDSQFWESPTRPWFLVVPAEGAPMAVIPEIGAPSMRETWIDDVRTWKAPSPEDDGTSLLAGAFEELGRRFGRIGLELGREHSLRMPIMQFFDLQQKTKRHELVNGSACIWQIRMIKTRAEIDHIRYICGIASAAYDSVPDLVHLGDTERDAARKLRIDLAARGADSTPFLPAISGAGGISQIVCGPYDRTLLSGDILFFDTGSTFDGYWCDFDRNYAMDSVCDAAKRAHESMWQATEAGIEAATVGNYTTDVYEAISKVIEQHGSAGGNVGRVGHGLGMQLTEPPSLMPKDDTRIEEGMVLAIEPGIEYAPGKMIVHEENIAIWTDGPELLTKRAPRELPIIQ